MAEERMALPDALGKSEKPAENPLRQMVRWAAQDGLCLQLAPVLQ
jgi:hypothetical protein